MTPITQIPLDTFNHQTVRDLDVYFKVDDQIVWFNNLLELSTVSLGMAHCIQHNTTAKKLLLDLAPQFDHAIGCYSSTKKLDTLRLEQNVVSGSKHWISNLQVADYGIMRVPSGSTEAYILFDFEQTPFKKEFNNTQLGMELAEPGTLIVDHYNVPPNYILGYRDFNDNQSPIARILSFHDYCFITNYLGCIIGLYRYIVEYAQHNNLQLNFEISKFKLEISSIKMLWADNLTKLEDSITDTFWHRRNTQYSQSKNILIQLINLGLSIGDSSWVSNRGKQNQKFRDALVFATHMSSFYKNLTTKQFLQI